MPAGWLDAVRGNDRPPPRDIPVRYVYVLSCGDDAGMWSPVGAFKTLTAADAAAQSLPAEDRARIEAIRLYASIADWHTG